MSAAVRTASLWRRGRSACLVVALSLLLPAGAIAAQSSARSRVAHRTGPRPAIAPAASFQRGDVLASVGGSINVYTPDGTLVATFASGTGAGSVCLDPNGHYLVALGVGLFDNTGSTVPSHWNTLTSTYGECAVDGSGNVYVGQGPSGGDLEHGFTGTVRKYDIWGNLLHTYTVATSPDAADTYNAPNLDLAPDECTLYYGDEGGSAIHRYNVCTNTQLTNLGTNSFGIRDQLRVLPDWRVAVTMDAGALLFDSSGTLLQTWDSFGGCGASACPLLRYNALDPDGHTFWIGGVTPGVGTCTGPPTSSIWRLDADSGATVSSFNLPCGTSVSGLAVYSPPLLGSADVSKNLDHNASGTAEAFATRVGYSGQLSRLHLYVASSSAASEALVGVYSDNHGHPGTLLTQGKISDLRAGSWNFADVSPIVVKSGQQLWIAILGPRGGGTLRFRDASGGGSSEASAQTNLTSLPASWTTGTKLKDGALSGFGS